MTDPVAPPRPAGRTRRWPGASHAALAALLALAAPVAAQDALTEPAPGRGGAASDLPAAPRPARPEAPRQAPEQTPEQAPRVGEQAGMGGQTDLPATAIIRELAPRAEESFTGTFRVDAPTGPVLVDVTYSVDLTIFFAYDSARLLPEALPQVDALGEALRAPELLPHAFLIAGHTDAVGSASYNLDLSYRRALAVADYLVATHGIDPARLVPHGWGEEYLRLPSDPGSGANRRVEVSLILPEEAAWHPRALRGPGQALVHPAAGHGSRDRLHHGPIRRSDLVDPRWRLASDALDDFHATPTWPGR
jgi:outer membrane protein OmpA-like peptidoglycan-associated protein